MGNTSIVLNKTEQKILEQDINKIAAAIFPSGSVITEAALHLLELLKSSYKIRYD